MTIKEYDKVLLKDGRIAYVTDIMKPGVAYVGDWENKDGSFDWGDIKHEDIVKVLPD